MTVDLEDAQVDSFSCKAVVKITVLVVDTGLAA
jgi:hypothetical protein